MRSEVMVRGELPSGPFIRVHILMSPTQNETQEARSALNTLISSSKRTSRVSSGSPPLGRPSPHTRFLSSSNNPRRGWGMASPGVKLQGAVLAGGRQAGGQLCCLPGLSPCWAVIKSRPWCEAFWCSSGALLLLVSLDVSLCLCCFPNSLLVLSQDSLHTYLEPNTTPTDVPSLPRISRCHC